MTGPTAIRAAVTERPDGSLVYLLRCSCLTVRGLTAPWEPASGLWARLDDERRRLAPLCPHRLPATLDHVLPLAEGGAHDPRNVQHGLGEQLRSVR